MSEELKEQFQKMTNDELIDFALEHLGKEHETVRQAALMEHFLRIKDDPNTIIEPAGNLEALERKLKQIIGS
ncbi:MAG: hypothetical protein MUD14_07965 [Hydrococcus sp. Prado102]|nr:hypothetical protein [Hydrococcus sp. Prado102]